MDGRALEQGNVGVVVLRKKQLEKKHDALDVIIRCITKNNTGNIDKKEVNRRSPKNSHASEI